MKNLAVFVSGSGTNMENIATHIEQGKLKNCRIALVVCDNLNAFALKRSANHKIKTFTIERQLFKTKREFESKIIEELKKSEIDFIILAGYMRIVGSDLLNQFKWKIINIHPALLPNFPGAHGIKDAWEAKAKETGVTVHFVDEGIDTGPIILQKGGIFLKDFTTLEELEAAVHQVEYELYPKAVQLLVDGKLSKS